MQDIIKSFNFKFYKEIVNQPFLKSWVFLVVFILIFTGMVGIKASLFFVSALDSMTKASFEIWQKQAVGEMPEIEIKNNELVSPNMTYIKEFKIDKEEIAFVVEPDSAPTKVNPVLDKYNNILLITKDKLIVKQKKTDNTFEQKTNLFKKIDYFKMVFGKDVIKLIFDKKTIDITPEVINKWVGIIKVFCFPIFWVFIFIWFNFTKMLHVLIFSLAAKLFSVILKANLEYKKLLSICVYAIIPSTVISVLAIIFGFPFLTFFYMPVYLIYIYFGIKNSNENTTV